MDELKKVKRVIQRLDAEAPQEVLLVLDANQVRTHSRRRSSLTRHWASRPGAHQARRQRARHRRRHRQGAEASDPIHRVGEKPEDFGPFDAQAFANALVDGAVQRRMRSRDPLRSRP